MSSLLLVRTRAFGNCSHSSRLPLLNIYWTDKITWPVSIMLAVNKESMWIDPIDWSAFKEDLSDWSEQNCPNLTIHSITDLKFSERLVPSHSPRTCAHGTEGSTKIYQFFSLTPPRHDNLKEMEMKGVPVHIAKLIYNISKHNPLLDIGNSSKSTQKYS